MAQAKTAVPSGLGDDPRRAILDSLRRLVRALRVLGAAGGPSPAQRFVLEQLAARPGSSIGDLARLTHTDQSSVSVVVSRLVQGELVERKRSGADARRAELSLTPRGRAVAKKNPVSGQGRLLEALDSLSGPRRASIARELDALVTAMGIDDEPAGMFFEEVDGPSTSAAKRPAKAAPKASKPRAAAPAARSARAAKPVAKRRLRA